MWYSALTFRQRVVLFGGAFLVLVVIGLLEQHASGPSLSPAERRQLRIGDQFSWRDGSHTALVDAVQSGLHNPASFDHVSTRYSDHGDTLTVWMIFRSANTYNAIITRMVRAEVTLDGTILSITEEP